MRNSLSDNRNLFKNQYFFTTKKWSRVHTAATIWRQVEDDDGWLCADSGGGDCSPSTPGVYRTDSWTAARSYLWVAVALPQRFCFNYTVERGLVIGFCSQPHYCCRPYYPTARFQSPLSYVVLMNSFRTGQGRHRALQMGSRPIIFLCVPAHPAWGILNQLSVKFGLFILTVHAVNWCHGICGHAILWI